METTKKTLKEQIAEVHGLFDLDFNTREDKIRAIHDEMKVVIEHVMKLEAKCYYIDKKLVALCAKAGVS